MLPTSDMVSAWLRERVRKPQPGLLARLFGEPSEFTYELGRPQARSGSFFRKHCLFDITGETGLLPFSTLPRGSWGVFALDDSKQLHLLKPDDAALLAREGRPLDEANPLELAELLCQVGLARKRNHRHTIVPNAEALLDPDFGRMGALGTYTIDPEEFQRVRGAIREAQIEVQPGAGWSLQFTSVWGWMHNTQELGVEVVHFSDRFELSYEPRLVLSRRIFAEVPAVLY